MTLNRVFLIGNLGRDPELRVTSTQVQVCTFSIATTERRKDQTGNWSDYTEWHNVVVFGNSAENSAKYLKKGSKAFIEGRIQTRKWQDKEGKDRYTTEVIAERVQFLSSSRGGERDPGAAYEPNPGGYSSGFNQDQSANSNTSQPTSIPMPIPMAGLKSADEVAGKSSQGDETSFDDDDIPF